MTHREAVAVPPSAKTVLAKPVLAAAVALAICLLAAAPAAAWEVRDDAPRPAFEAFHEHFATAAYHYPRHGAAPLGLVGFELYADLSADLELEDEDFFTDAVSGDLPAGALSVARVGVRKGLPGNVDLGLAYGTVLDGDLDLLSADVQWAFLDGGAVSPAMALRFTGTQTLSGDPYELDQYGAELLLSKGFTILSLYGGAGVAWSEGTLARATGGELTVDGTQSVLYAGVVLNLLLPKITVEAEQGEGFQVAARLAFGF